MIEFWKFQGCGNDFLIMEEKDDIDYDILSEHICDRHYGIGADGIILVRQDPLSMRIFNQDGSEATMCGNGIRCFVRFCYEILNMQEREFLIHTKAGSFCGRVLDESASDIEIDMGTPSFTMEHTGLVNELPVINYPFYMHFHVYMITTMFFGTIHTVLFVADADDGKWQHVGRQMHQHPFFRKKTNVNFVEIVNDHAIKVRTYEKGVGMTLACGSGACASAYCAYMLHFCKDQMEVYLKSSMLHIQIKEDRVLMRGPAKYIGKGIYLDKEETANGST